MIILKKNLTHWSGLITLEYWLIFSIGNYNIIITALRNKIGYSEHETRRFNY